MKNFHYEAVSILVLGFVLSGCGAAKEAITPSGLILSQELPGLQTNAEVPADTGKITYNMAEIAKHNKQGDCWLAVDDRAYDTTALIPVHKEGSEKIAPFCGKDASGIFGIKHKPEIKGMLEKYFLHDLE